MTSYGIIYRAVNTINGKCNVGQTTVDLERRKYQHKWEATQRKRTKDTYTPFYNAINKYGWDAFEWEILTECECQDNLNEQEKYYVTYYKENGPGVYNVKPGGSQDHKKRVGRNHSPETIAKMTGQKRTPEQIQNMKDSWNNRKPMSEETKARVSARLSEVNKGKVLSEEHKAKIKAGVARVEYTPELRHAIGAGGRGKKRTDEHKAIISKTHKGKVVGEETREKISSKNKGKKRTPEQIQNIIDRNTGSKRSEETKKKMGESSKKAWKKRKGEQYD